MVLTDWRTEVQSLIRRLQALLVQRIIPNIDISKESLKYLLFTLVSFPEKWAIFTVESRMEGKVEFTWPPLTEEEKDVLREELIVFLLQKSKESLEKKKIGI